MEKKYERGNRRTKINRQREKNAGSIMSEINTSAAKGSPEGRVHRRDGG